MKSSNYKKGITLFLGISVVVLGLAAYQVVLRRDANSEPVAPSNGESFDLEIACPVYSQMGASWSKDELGNSGGSLGSYGCTICSASMALGSYGIDLDPRALNRRLITKGGFTESGLLIWKSLAEVAGPDYEIVVRNRFDSQDLDESLRAGNPLIAKVLYQGRIWHWVLVVGKKGADYLIIDPLSDVGVELARNHYSDGFYAIRYLNKH